MIAAEPLMLALRFLHIVSGVLWVGAAFLFVGFIGPSAAEVGPSAGPLLSVAVKKRKVAKVITLLGLTAVIAGWLMWLRNLDAAGSLGNWLDSSYGIVLTVGGLLATAAFFTGYLGVGRNVERMVDLGDAIREGGQPPTEQQMAEMGRLGGLLEKHGKTDLALLLLAVTAMATARYW